MIRKRQCGTAFELYFGSEQQELRRQPDDVAEHYQRMAQDENRDNSRITAKLHDIILQDVATSHETTMLAMTSSNYGAKTWEI